MSLRPRLRGARAAAALALAALAASASATPSGRKWFLGSNPSPGFAVYDHGAANRPVNGVSWATALQTVRNSYARWVAPNVGCTSWSTTYDGVFLTPAGQAAVNGNDGRNLVVFLGGTDLGWSWPHDAATLALTTTTYFTGTGEIFDGDMEINNNFSWKAAGEGNQASAFDLESVVTHEAGHFLGLSHTPASTAVMYASFSAGEVRSNLSAADLDDVCGVYPGTAPVGEIGTFCAGDQNCSGGYPFCRAPAATTSGARICTRECTTEDCPAGYSCQFSTPAGATGKACLVKPGSPDLCQFCTSDQECSTGLCAYDDQGHRWCTTSCQQAADCGAGCQCTPTGQPNLSVCQPQNANGDTCNATDIPGFPGQCTGDAQCAPGYGCAAGGYCQAPGTVGSRCELSNYCGSCAVCIGTLEEAYCRACCGGTGGGGACSACLNPACSAGFTCYTVVGSADNVCAPSSAAGACQACDGSTPCNDGMQCIAGRCHAACNPDHPGRCAACFPTGPGTGVCACADQVVGTGASCGIQPGGDFLACSAGSWCAGSPPTCLGLCTLGDNSTCTAGQTCSLLDGRAVCTGGSTPAGSRCGMAVGTSCSGIACAAGLTCYEGRCYEPCNPAAPACNPAYGCVGIPGGGAVCACSDQRSAAYGPCGAVQGGVYACSNGLACVGNMCRVPCDATAPCPGGGACETVNGVSVCSLPPGVDAGMYGPPGGCGCAAGGWAGIFPVMLALVLLVRATERRAGARRGAS